MNFTACLGSKLAAILKYCEILTVCTAWGKFILTSVVYTNEYVFPNFHEFTFELDKSTLM